jgi:hypothetical protein
MDITRAALLLDKSWSDIEFTILQQKDGFLLDAPVVAAMLCISADGKLDPLEDCLCAAIIDLLETFSRGQTNPNGTVFIPCDVHPVGCLKDFFLRDALDLLPTGAEGESPRKKYTHESNRTQPLPLPLQRI